MGVSGEGRVDRSGFGEGGSGLRPFPRGSGGLRGVGGFSGPSEVNWGLGGGSVGPLRASGGLSGGTWRLWGVSECF